LKFIDAQLRQENTELRHRLRLKETKGGGKGGTSHCLLSLSLSLSVCLSLPLSYISVSLISLSVSLSFSLSLSLSHISLISPPHTHPSPGQSDDSFSATESLKLKKQLEQLKRALLDKSVAYDQLKADALARRPLAAGGGTWIYIYI
jgi:hypothetical protein